MLPLLERELIEKRQWTTSEELLDYYAISQTTPGIIAVNVSTFIGHKRKGILGGIFSTLGMISPSLIIITLLAKFISNFENILWVQKAMKGINAAVAGLLFYSVMNICKKNIKNWWSILIMCASFTAMYFFKVHTLFITLGAAIIGTIIFTIQKIKENKQINGDENK